MTEMTKANTLQHERIGVIMDVGIAGVNCETRLTFRTGPSGRLRAGSLEVKTECILPSRDNRDQLRKSAH